MCFSFPDARSATAFQRMGTPETVGLQKTGQRDPVIGTLMHYFLESFGCGFGPAADEVENLVDVGSDVLANVAVGQPFSGTVPRYLAAELPRDLLHDGIRTGAGALGEEGQ